MFMALSGEIRDREFGKFVDEGGKTAVRISEEEKHLTMLVAYGTSGNALNRQEYVGWAAPGTATSAAGWRICKLEYNASGMNVSKKWADSSADFDKIWDSKGDYTYA